MNQAAFILAFLMVVAAPPSFPADADARVERTSFKPRAA
jgi:hypothetical protein